MNDKVFVQIAEYEILEQHAERLVLAAHAKQREDVVVFQLRDTFRFGPEAGAQLRSAVRSQRLDNDRYQAVLGVLDELTATNLSKVSLTEFLEETDAGDGKIASLNQRLHEHRLLIARAFLVLLVLTFAPMKVSVKTHNNDNNDNADWNC